MSSSTKLPAFSRGQRIGLYGGSFNPPHEGHRLVCEIALRRLRLNQVWMLPTIGNPLKFTGDLAPLEDRIAALKKLIPQRNVKILTLEAATHMRYTIDTLSFILKHGRGARFVWLMGTDNLIQFSRWRRWRAIADLAPIAIIDRPGSSLRAGAGKAAQALGRKRLQEEKAPLLADRPPPAWVWLHDRRSFAASSAIRRGSQP